ncbi:uncharacterized protein LOC105425173 isoform X3 [Pogonomyrmex barbatus]|nr:uncharacterized protein LOC105425173 isoform X3 [Pogonomyrmex barbatus]
MPQCAVATCRNSHRRTRKQSVRYHRFPHNPELRELWVRACGRTPLANGEPPFNIKTARICSQHFLTEFYEDESREQIMQGNQKRNRLRLGAVPTEDVPVRVKPCFKLLNETEKKRSATRTKISSLILSDQSDTPRPGCKRSSKEDSGESSSSGKTLCDVKEHAECPIEKKRAKLDSSLCMDESCTVDESTCFEDQEGIFLMAVGLVRVNSLCLNKMHAMEGAAENKRKVDVAENRADDKTSSRSSPSPKVPQSQQNGAALPEETAAAPTTTVSARPRIKKKDESDCDNETSDTRDRQLLAGTSRQNATAPSKNVQPRHVKAASEPIDIKKRKSTNGQLISLGNPRKKFREDFSREEYLLSIVGDNNESVEDLMAKADQLRADILALENLAHAKEMEWNEILRKRKLKEEAYLRLERKIQTTTYMENDSQLPEASPSVKPSLGLAEWENSSSTISMKDKSFESKEDSGEKSLDSCLKKEKITRVSSQQRATPPKTNGESNRKQNETASPESRQIGEGRQGAIVDVRSIIADHRLKHPETVPRRGRRMRSSNVNINLGAGGAMVETGHNADSRPSSTESCKSNPSTNDSMNYKDMLVQFAKLSQQGEIVKTPQNYPDVTLHPVTPSSAQNTPQSSGSLLHGILTKAQTPRSTTFSPTLARLLTAPERERSSPTTAAAATASASMSQQSGTTQHLLQTYQGSNLVSINDLLSSSKARTEITITPVVNTPAQSHSNDLIQVEDIEEETTDDRKGNSIAGRDGKQIVKDNPPSPSAPPKCQGCRIRPAQFVCAGCGNQWYCSRSCQLAAWATHSDHCPPEPENSKTKLV